MLLNVYIKFHFFHLDEEQQKIAKPVNVESSKEFDPLNKREQVTSTVDQHKVMSSFGLSPEGNFA